jgi:hypothetical protein
MIYRRLLTVSAILIVSFLAACAPYDLDITPSATPTPPPTATPTPEATATLDAASEPADALGAIADDDQLQLLLDAVVAAVPATLPAGAVQWRVDAFRDPENLTNISQGVAKRVFFTEQQGGQANLTFGVFETPEDAHSHYEFIRGIRSSLERGTTDENFPQPNLFGSGLYGSNAIFQQDNIFVEVSVELFSSTAGNPLPGLSRQALSIVERGLSDFGEIAATLTTDTDTTTAGEPGDPNQARLDDLLANVPQSIAGGAIQWQLDSTREWENLRNINNGVATRVYYTERGGSKSSITFGAFDTPEDSLAHFEFIAGIRTQLQNANSLDAFPQPNLFRTGLYGSVAIIQIENVFIEVFIEQVSGTAENPLNSLARAAVRVVEEAPPDA